MTRLTTSGIDTGGQFFSIMRAIFTIGLVLYVAMLWLTSIINLLVVPGYDNVALREIGPMDQLPAMTDMRFALDLMYGWTTVFILGLLPGQVRPGWSSVTLGR